MTDLGTLGGTTSNAYGINDLGQVVGNSGTGDGQWHAFLWTALAGLVDLNDLLSGAGVTLYAALGINDAGQIVAYGMNELGETHAFVLDPDSQGDPVPEPATVALTGTGLLALAAASRRRRKVTSLTERNT